jgi:transcription antitermination factor NusG
MTMTETTGNMAQVRAALEPTVEEIRQPHPFTRWYMALARPNHEQEAADSFRRNNVRAYWPNYERMQTVRRRGDNRPELRLILTAIVPGYVFSPGSPLEDFENLIERISGIINVVRTFSGSPLMLDEPDIAIIRRIEAGLNTPEPARSVHTFKTGEKVRFIDDLVGRWPKGKIVKLARDGRISTETELMGRKVVVIAFPHQIERA